MIASPASSNRLKNALETAKVINAIAPNVPVGIWSVLIVWPNSNIWVQNNMYAKNMFRIARLSWPPHTMQSCITCTVEKIPTLVRFTHMLVHALLKKSSPVNDAWIYPYLENCSHILSHNHARKLTI